MKQAGATEIGNVVVELGERVPAEARQYAHDKIAPLSRYAPAPVQFARVRLTRPGPRTINLDVNGSSLPAQAEAATFAEAIDEVHDQLHTRLLKMHN